MKNAHSAQRAGFQALTRFWPATNLIAASLVAATLFDVCPARAGSDSKPIPIPASRIPTARAEVVAQPPTTQTSCAGKIALDGKAADHFGGKIYSTGTGDIMVTIQDPASPALTPPTSASVGIPGSITPPTTRQSEIPSDIYLIYPKPARLIGAHNMFGTTINLGKLPAGEIILGLKTFDHYTLVSGNPTNNPDRLVHAVVRTYPSVGRMQVWFEDAPGPKGWGRSDRNFTDVVLELTGDVTDSSAVADLLKVIKEQQGTTRQAAINALKQINPLAAADAGY